MADPKVAIVHDWLVSSGGAEKTLLQMHKIWPEAPIYTAAYLPEVFPEFRSADIRVTWLDKIKLAKTKHQLFSLPRALAFKMLDLSDYDIVISSSSAESKYVRTGGAMHICYCYTPIRYYWSDYDWYLAHPPFGALNPVIGWILPVMIPWLRKMDYDAAQRPHHFVGISEHIKKRIKRYYNREATVIYPPVNTSRFSVAKKAGEYYLIVGRQVAYKRLDLAVDVFNQLGLPLVVAGSGEEVAKQAKRAKANIKLVGRVNDEELAKLYQGAIALVFPQEEDFGIVPVEAMAAGRPVIAYKVGGAAETVIDGTTGVLFEHQTVQSLTDAVVRLQSLKIDPEKVRKQAERFDNKIFAQAFSEHVAKNYKAHLGE